MPSNHQLNSSAEIQVVSLFGFVFQRATLSASLGSLSLPSVWIISACSTGLSSLSTELTDFGRHVDLKEKKNTKKSENRNCEPVLLCSFLEMEVE